ncbi:MULTISPECIES: VanZ family protein [unclassified Actinomyces]|uniref:VanZ family protein n=1 Tax=unclassified Actinomyces TaxID=2609248 RepID=UPI000D594E77|nr:MULTISPECIES: VanZ family protein [unclassified Actinomyces]RAX19114.1 VanZ family protein [Actinomyces sp. Z3]
MWTGYRTTRVLAAGYLLVVLFAVLWPSGGDVAAVKAGLGPWFLTPAGKDIALNLAMLAPLTFLACLGWPRVPWWTWVLAGCALSLGAELMQWALPALDRRPSLFNVVQNGVGAWLGVALAGLLSHRRRASGTDTRRA